MLVLKGFEPARPLLSAEVSSVFAGEVDCGRFSQESTSPECEERGQTALGILVVAAVLILAIGFIVWRLMLRKIDEPPAGDPGDLS
jgi:hypothetical protein